MLNVFGERLAKLRKQDGLTQKELAEKLDLATGTIQQYELGTRRPDCETVTNLAALFNVSTDYLLGVSPVVRSEFTAEDVFNLSLAIVSAQEYLEEALKRLRGRRATQISDKYPPSNNLNTYERIDKILKERNMSRRQLAIAADIPPSTLQSALERQKNMTLEAVMKIAAVLGVTFNFLMGKD